MERQRIDIGEAESTAVGVDSEIKRGRGRPRSPEVERRILDAAVELLADEGWHGFAIEALATRAGVGKATVYRRWSSKEEIVIAALESLVEDFRRLDSGSLRTDLRALLGTAARSYQEPHGRLLPALASAMEQSEELARAVRGSFLAPRRANVRATLDRARVRGELAADADFDLMHDMLAGVLLYRRLITRGPLDEALVEGLVSAFLRAFSPEEPQSTREENQE